MSHYTLELFKSYFKQARDELGLRLLDRLFDADGTKNKWWQVMTGCFRVNIPL